MSRRINRDAAETVQESCFSGWFPRPGKDGKTPLQLAALSGRARTLAALLRAGAPLDARALKWAAGPAKLYLERVGAAGGFAAYADRKAAALAAGLARLFHGRLPSDLAPLVTGFWAHPGDY